MQIEADNNGTGSVLRVSGEVDLSSSPKLRESILDRLGAGDLDVDLSDAKYIDSSGLATLVEGLKRSRNQGRNFRLVAPSEAVLRVLRLARLDNLFTIVDDPASAGA